MKQVLPTLHRTARSGRWIALWLASCFVAIAAQAQVTVNGTVTDDTNEPLIGVTIVEKGTTNGATTNLEGKYTLQVPQGATLVFSYIGFDPQEVTLEGQTTLNVTLLPTVTALREIVVVGYGTQKKSDLTGAIATVDRDQLQQVATTDPNLALQGRVPGVQITNNSGAPGAGMKVRIRGVGTINNSNPLYVVDGFPTGDISNIPPSDIASVEVLKDASATAIYGSRGANGVIIITTNRGSNGRTQVQFNAYYGAQQAWKRLDLLNASQYAELRMEAFNNDGLTPSTFTQEKLQFVMDNNAVGTDWQEAIFRPATLQQYNLAITGGTQDFKYSLSGTYFDREGIVDNTYLTKGFTRFNADFRMAPQVTGGINLAYTYDEFTNYNSSAYFGPLGTALRKDPVTAITDASTGTWDRSNLSDISNPARILAEAADRINRGYRVQTGGFVNIDLAKGLVFTSRFTIDRKEGINTSYVPSFYITNNEQREQSVFTRYNSQQVTWVNSNFLNYSKNLGGSHDISVLVGMEAYRNRWNFHNVQALDVPANQDVRYVSASQSPDDITATDGESVNKILSYFARANYTLGDRYLFTATARYDGSSKFVGNNRWGFFPSFSAGWNMHNETFFPQSKVLNYAKLRAGWGEVGNEQSVGAYEYLTLVSPGFNYTFGGVLVSGAIPTTLANPSIRWETTRTTNVGADFGFFEDRVIASVDWFEKRTLGMLYRQPVPGFAGALGASANIGDVQNQGLELMAEYRHKQGNLDVNVGINATRITNTVLSLGGGEPVEVGFESKTGGPTTRTEEGDEIGFFYGLQTDGIFKSQEEIDAYTNSEGNLIQPNAQPGDVKYIDVNGDGTIDFSSDRAKLGSAFPDWTLGFTTTAKWNGFDLNLLFNASVGNEIANMMTYYLEHPSAQENSLATRMDRWTPENPSSNEPRVTTIDLNKNYLFSDRYIEDGSYLRLKNIQLGYTLPESIMPASTRLRLYASSDNLLTFTRYSGFDPEVGDYFSNALHAGVDYAGYPQARTIIGGLQLSF